MCFRKRRHLTYVFPTSVSLIHPAKSLGKIHLCIIYVWLTWFHHFVMQSYESYYSSPGGVKTWWNLDGCSGFMLTAPWSLRRCVRQELREAHGRGKRRTKRQPGDHKDDHHHNKHNSSSGNNIYRQQPPHDHPHDHHHDHHHHHHELRNGATHIDHTFLAPQSSSNNNNNNTCRCLFISIDLAQFCHDITWIYRDHEKIDANFKEKHPHASNISTAKAAFLCLRGVLGKWSQWSWGSRSMRIRSVWIAFARRI